MSINRSGFNQTNNGLEIDKSTQAQLVYSFDWSDWLNEGDVISNVVYSVAARRNDPVPIQIEDQGLGQSAKITYVELSGGQAAKSYIVTAVIDTQNGLRDSRNFRINVLNRSA